MIQEVRGLKSDPFSDKFKAGHVIHGTEGFIAEASVFDPDGQLVKTFKAPARNHFENFISAVRSRRADELNADILEGHQSTALCHIGNISYRLGEKLHREEIAERLEGLSLHPEAVISYRKMIKHLASYDIDLDQPTLRLGQMLNPTATSEEFEGNAAANQLLTREYRKPFSLPS